MLVAVVQAHAAGVVHRDVKPGNALLVDGRVKLSDFGLGRTLARPAHLQTRMFRGTEAYASPEQLLGWPVDHRADLYAVGVVLYEMLMGVRPIAGRQHASPRARFSNVTVRLEAFLSSLLSLVPRGRPPSALAALKELDEIAREYLMLHYLYSQGMITTDY